MDLQTILVGSAFILLSVLPIFIFNQLRRNKEKQKLRILSNLAKQHNGLITNYETGEHWSIGLDNQDILLFIYHGEPEKIDLKEIKQCKTSSNNRNVTQNKMQYVVIEDVSLLFEPNNKQVPTYVWHLYNAERDNHSLADELKQAEKWQKIITQRIIEIKKRETFK